MTPELYRESAFIIAILYNKRPKEAKGARLLLQCFKNEVRGFRMLCREEEYLIPFISMDGTIEYLDTEQGLWIWDSKEGVFKMET